MDSTQSVQAAGGATVIVVANHKGGCAKTTSTANLGAALAMAGSRVLMIDCDPQANLSEAFGIDEMTPGARLDDALDGTLDELPVWAYRVDEDGELRDLAAGVNVVPCSDRLEQAVSDREGEPGFALRLATLVGAFADVYDVVLIDTPPGLNALSSMGLLAADWVLIPARPADFDIAGALKIVELVEGPLRETNPRLQVLGVLMTQASERWRLSQNTRERLAEMQVPCLNVTVPFMVRAGAAARAAAPTVVQEPRSTVARAYAQLAADIQEALLSGGVQESAA